MSDKREKKKVNKNTAFHLEIAAIYMQMVQHVIVVYGRMAK